MLSLVLALPLLLPPGDQPAARETYPQPVRARHGMVAGSCRIASQVGAEILEQGGNAADAAVAVGLALAVTHPSAGNLGGGGFMLVRMSDGREAAVDYRETAPRASTGNMYLDEQGELIPDVSLVGYLAAGVPGTVAGLSLALEEFGSLPWSALVEPALRLAEQGFPVSHRLADEFREYEEKLSRFPESRRIFLRDGAYYEAGDTLRQPELAATLQRLQEVGPQEFYQGLTAHLIVEDMRANDGLIDERDLAEYRPVIRRPLHGSYRGLEVLSMPPPSSGGIALLEMLNILEGFQLAELGHDSSAMLHLLVETQRLAFADRAEFPGDPAFLEIPVEGLVSKEYAAGLRENIDPGRAASSRNVRHGNPKGFGRDGALPEGGEEQGQREGGGARDQTGGETTHFTVVDGEGNAVANTYTINSWFGSGAVVAGAGFLLNNEMDDFTTCPGSPNQFGLIQGAANSVSPGKRPLSSMTPTILLREGEFHMALGSVGGPKIISAVLQTIVNVADHGMNIQRAISVPRVHHQWLPDSVYYEDYGLSRDVREALEAKGHAFIDQPKKSWGDVQAVMRDPETGILLGASDPRNPDASSLGY